MLMRGLRHQYLWNCWRSRYHGELQKRSLNTELAHALRPFYFIVHPDLFGQHPKERNVNEDSLKQLTEHMESLYERKYHVLHQPKTLHFYIRDKTTTSRNIFRLIKITLDKRIQDPKTLIQKLLELTGLPIDDVKKIKSVAVPSSADNGSGLGNASNFKAGQDVYYGQEFKGFTQTFYQAREETKKTLSSWIEEHAAMAIARGNELADLKEEVAKLQKSIVQRLELKEVRYDCGWNIEHFRGCLKTLERLAQLHEMHMDVLKNRVVVFAPFTGVSLEGHVMLYTGDVLNSWIDFIKNIPKHDNFLKKIPLFENTLSQVLRNIKIGHRKFMPKQQAMEYAAHLRMVTTTLGDYLTFNKFPKTWPETLKDYEIVVESEAGPLMINPTGQFIAPATCPGFMLIDFITTNLSTAKERMASYKEQVLIEQDLVERCTKHMQLKTLTKDDSVTPEKMIQTLNKLLICDPKSFANINLHITNYYSVLMDGIVCIPWDFERR